MRLMLVIVGVHFTAFASAAPVDFSLKCSQPGKQESVNALVVLNDDGKMTLYQIKSLSIGNRVLTKALTPGQQLLTRVVRNRDEDRTTLAVEFGEAADKDINIKQMNAALVFPVDLEKL